MAGEQGTVRVGSSGIIEDSEGKILMALRGVYPSNIWVFPGGGINFGEDSADAFIRESREETGLEIEKPEFITVFELIKPTKNIHRVIFFYKSKMKGGILKPNDDVSELKWLTVDEIVEMKNLGEVVMPVLKFAGYV